MFWIKPKSDNFHSYMDKIIGGIINCCNTYIRTNINAALPEIDPTTVDTNDNKTLLKLILLQLSIAQTQSMLMDKGNFEALTKIISALTPSPEQIEMHKQMFEDFKKHKQDEDEGNWWKRGTEPTA